MPVKHYQGDLRYPEEEQLLRILTAELPDSWHLFSGLVQPGKDPYTFYPAIVISPSSVCVLTLEAHIAPNLEDGVKALRQKIHAKHSNNRQIEVRLIRLSAPDKAAVRQALETLQQTDSGINMLANEAMLKGVLSVLHAYLERASLARLPTALQPANIPHVEKTGAQVHGSYSGDMLRSEEKGIAFLQQHLPSNYHIFHNLEFSKSSGETFDVDVLIVGRLGVYLLELKNHSGTVSGNMQKFRVDDPNRPTTYLNGVKQLKHYARVLFSTICDELSLQKSDFALESAFFFSHPDVTLALDDRGASQVTHTRSTVISFLTQPHGFARSPMSGPIQQDILTFIKQKFDRMESPDVIGYYQLMREYTVQQGLSALQPFLKQYKARHMMDETEHLLKIYDLSPISPAERDDYLQRMNHEAHILSHVLNSGHPNIVRIGSTFLSEQDNNRYVLPLEWVGGASVRHRLHEDNLSIDEAVDIIRQAAKRVTYLHRHKIIHRNLRPESLIVPEDAPVRITNLGFARVIDEKLITRFLDVDDFNLSYIAPEMNTDLSRATIQTDIYALGVTFYEMLGGDVKSATEGGVLTVTPLPDVPETVYHVLRKMCAADPTERYTDLKTMIRDLDIRPEQPSFEGSLDSKLLSGDVFADRYIIHHWAGGGASSDVYAARDENMEIDVALKIMRPDVDGVLDGDRFTRGARIMARIQHPNIIPIRDVGRVEVNDRQVHYIVMPFAGDGTLEDFLQNQAQQSDDQEVYNILEPICSALDYIHMQNVVHGDIKPSNILLNLPDGIWLADFSLSFDMQSISIAGQRGGTPYYVAPEILQENPDEPATTLSDIYSLGIMLAHMLTGKPPQEFIFYETNALNVEVLQAHIENPALIELLRQATHPDPVARIKTAREVLQLFVDAVAPGQSLQANRDLFISRMEKQARLYLGIFPPDIPVPVSIIYQVLQMAIDENDSGDTDMTAADLLDNLVRLQLVRRTTQSQQSHINIPPRASQLLRDYATPDQIQMLHQDLLTVQQAETWLDLAWEADTQHYWVRHLCYHLAGAGYYSDLYQLILETPNWRTRRHESGTSLLNDIELAIATWEQADEADEWTLVRLHLAYHMMLADEQHLTEQDVVWLALDQDLDGAYQYIFSVQNTMERFSRLATLHETLHTRPDSWQIVEKMQALVDEASQKDDLTIQQGILYARLAQAMRYYDPDIASEYLQEAYRQFPKARGDFVSQENIGRIAVIHAQADDTDRAYHLLHSIQSLHLWIRYTCQVLIEDATARDTDRHRRYRHQLDDRVQQLEEPWQQAEACASMAAMYRAINESFENRRNQHQLERLLDQITSPIAHDSALRRLVRLLLDDNQLDEAIHRLATFQTGYWQRQAVLMVAITLRLQEDTTRLTGLLAQYAPLLPRQSDVLPSIRKRAILAALYQRHGLEKKSRDMFWDVRQTLLKMSSGSDVDAATSLYQGWQVFCLALTHARRLTDALTVLDEYLPDVKYRLQTLHDILYLINRYSWSSSTRSGELHAALQELLDSTDDPWLRCLILSDLAISCHSSNPAESAAYREEARELIDRLDNPLAKIIALIYSLEPGSVSNQQERLRDIETLIKTRLMPDQPDYLLAMKAVGQAYLKVGQPARARRHVMDTLHGPLRKQLLQQIERAESELLFRQNAFVEALEVLRHQPAADFAEMVLIYYMSQNLTADDVDRVASIFLNAEKWLSVPSS